MNKQLCNLDSASLQIDGELYRNLLKFCKATSLDMDYVLLAAWNKLMQIYCNVDQTTVGIIGLKTNEASTAKQEFEYSEKSVFTITIEWNKNKSFIEIVKTIHQKVKCKSSLCFSIKNRTKQGRSFENLFVIQRDKGNFLKIIKSVEKTDLQAILVSLVQKDRVIFLLKTLREQNIFIGQPGNQILSQFHNILIQICNTSNRSKGHEDISLFSKNEQLSLFKLWNQTDRDFPKDLTLSQLFEKQVEIRGNEIAVVFEDEKLTYSELNKKVNELARYILVKYRSNHDHDLPTDTLIALFLDRSLEIVISILAVLKAGAAYVPISTENPTERIEFILNDTKTPIILTQERYVDMLSIYDYENTLTVIDIKNIENDKGKDANLSTFIHPTNLAYVIYTSGTTGQPKGVMLEHASVLNTLYGMSSIYSIDNENRRISVFTNYTFDVFVSEVFNGILFGGEIHILSDSVRKNVEKLANYILENEIQFLYLPPSVLATIPKLKFPSVKKIIFAGETCSQEQCIYWHENYELYNYYGPTETSIYASGKRTCKRNLNEIGSPIPNVKLYVLDEKMSVSAIGIPGELYIGGPGLARGYLNNSNLTKEKFIKNPFKNGEDKLTNVSRLYKTGDKVRWLPDGNLEYLGRNDFQIKLNGYRIELAEIEKKMEDWEMIKQAVVFFNKERKQLIAGYIPTSQIIPYKELRAYIEKRLPVYMIPSAFIPFNSFPVSHSGKVDRQLIANAIETNVESNKILLTGSIENKIMNIWQSVLAHNQFDVNSSFFDVGGSSILLTKILEKIKLKLKINISHTEFFRYPTIKSISQYIRNEPCSQRISSERAILQQKALIAIRERHTLNKKATK